MNCTNSSHPTRLVSGAFLIETVYDSRRHRTRLQHLGQPLLRTCALAPLVCIIPRYLPRTLPEHVHLTRHDPTLLNFPPTLPPQAGILKAGGVGIEFSLKAKHALVLVNAETAQKSAPWVGSSAKGGSDRVRCTCSGKVRGSY